MDALSRKPMQGVYNIIRFNWHFFVMAIGGIITLLLLAKYGSPILQALLIAIAIGMLLSMIISLTVSWYVYDRSALYTLNWMPATLSHPQAHIVNIHAGFDETSALLARKYPDASLTVFDFYDPQLHTEVSIRRARKAYLPYPGTQAINTSHIPLEANTVDHIYLILAAHEIRSDEERTRLFTQLKNALRSNGAITVVEHLRDVNNFLAYNIGAFHFLSRYTWHNTFAQAGLQVDNNFSLTPFIAVYTLTK
ncbi:MAG: methyltransferase [Niastella sp.]|nr:methyltransferase [Niastella sp.]